MNIYKARYLNALKMAAKVNRLLKKGYHLFFDGVPNEFGFVMEGNRLLLKTGDYTSVIYYENDKEWDHGYYTKISDWNKNFRSRIHVYRPDAKVVL